MRSIWAAFLFLARRGVKIVSGGTPPDPCQRSRPLRRGAPLDSPFSSPCQILFVHPPESSSIIERQVEGFHQHMVCSACQGRIPKLLRTDPALIQIDGCRNRLRYRDICPTNHPEVSLLQGWEALFLVRKQTLPAS